MLDLLHTPAGAAPTKRPLLFVHGVYHGAWCFQEHFVPYFAALGHPCYALTLRGHAAASGAPCRFGRQDLLDDVREALDAIGPDALAIGHSLGGMLLQTLIAEGRVTDAVLLATPTPAALFLRSLRYTVRRPALMLPAWLCFDMQRVYHRSDVVQHNFFSPDVAPAALERYLTKLREVSYGGWSFLKLLLAPIPRPPASVRARVLVVGGRNDPTCTPKVEAEIASWYGGAAVIVDGVSHDLMLETRWRDVADVVRRWLDGEAPSRSLSSARPPAPTPASPEGAARSGRRPRRGSRAEAPGG